MLYLLNFIIGVWVFFIWSIIFYIIKPKHFFITINHSVISRFNLLVYWFLISVVVFIGLCLLIIVSGFKEGVDQPIGLFFIGFIAGIPLLYFLNKKKFNIKKVIKAKPSKVKELVYVVNMNKPQLDGNITNSKPVVEKCEKENIPTNLQNIEIEVKPYKEPTIYVSPSIGEYQPWNRVSYHDKNDFDEDHDEIELDSELPEYSGYRYSLEYKDRFGTLTNRGIDITAVHKNYSNNRWYFLADTNAGERTFKSQRVVRLKDQWFGKTYNTSKEIREHILSEYDVIEDFE
ncbi:ABC-2 transporter permease [Acinetobacter bereziniae]|uniref:hypothetical protein n=1 Tax=Acinetobacter bereziniae TaxID=106648 RepID=UPI00124FB4B7|nr:hypothetical protein [Acinetobacter bereziniae]MBJ9903651.1 hypothetical protein [Acinetobacter bereziniae]MCU4321659.1 ABC transporter permease [Acinetobacter bereziniae]MCU4601311.1 ABC transporter permease [Acinetobacter bereziniae]